MTNGKEVTNNVSEDINCYLTVDERRHLVTSLHDILAWIGVQPPNEFRIGADLMEKEMEKFNLKEEDIPPELHLFLQNSTRIKAS